MFEVIHHAQRLAVVFESAVVDHQLGEGRLAAVPEGRVSEVVCQRDGFDEVFVQSQRPSEVPPDLGDLQRVGQPRAEVVVLVGHEHLGFEIQPSERRTVHDAVAVPLEAGAVGVLGLVVGSSAAVGFADGVAGHLLDMQAFEEFPCGRQVGHGVSSGSWSSPDRRTIRS